MFYLWSRKAPRCHKHWAEGRLHIQLLTAALGTVRHGFERLQPFAEVCHRFDIGRALESTPACLCKEGNRLFYESCLHIVMGQEFRLCLDCLRKARHQHLRNALMVLLPGALEQRLVCCLLNKGMLETIRRPRWHPALVEQF